MKSGRLNSTEGTTANSSIGCELVFVFLLVGAYQDISWPFRYRGSLIDQSQTWGGLEHCKTGWNGRDCTAGIFNSMLKSGFSARLSLNVNAIIILFTITILDDSDKLIIIRSRSLDV